MATGLPNMWMEKSLRAGSYWEPRRAPAAEAEMCGSWLLPSPKNLTLILYEIQHILQCTMINYTSLFNIQQSYYHVR